MIWIAVDAMGGDFAPQHVVDGALAATRHFDLGVALVGRASAVETELARHAGASAIDRDRIRVVHADIEMRQRGERTVDNGARRRVAAHGVNGNPDHRPDCRC